MNFELSLLGNLPATLIVFLSHAVGAAIGSVFYSAPKLPKWLFWTSLILSTQAFILLWIFAISSLIYGALSVLLFPLLFLLWYYFIKTFKLRSILPKFGAMGLIIYVVCALLFTFETHLAFGKREINQHTNQSFKNIRLDFFEFLYYLGRPYTYLKLRSEDFQVDFYRIDEAHLKAACPLYESTLKGNSEFLVTGYSKTSIFETKILTIESCLWPNK